MQQPIHLRTIFGFIRTVNAIPTYAPRRVEEQIIIYIDDYATPTTKRLYIYSPEAQIWNYVALT